MLPPPTQLSPVIRERMDIDLSDAIVVVDEAHNVEDTCRDAARWA